MNASDFSPPPTAARPWPSSSPTMSEVRARMRRLIRRGFTPESEIVETVLADEPEPVRELLRPRAEGVLGLLMDRLKQRARRWPAETDCDRLDRAFDRLEAAGVLARQNYQCCSSCALAAMGEEIGVAAALRGHDAIRGWVLYHEQDTDAALERGELRLRYWSVKADDDAARAIGAEVVDALTQCGLAPVWSGSVEDVIVVPIRWRRFPPS